MKYRTDVKLTLFRTRPIVYSTEPPVSSGLPLTRWLQRTSIWDKVLVEEYDSECSTEVILQKVSGD